MAFLTKKEQSIIASAQLSSLPAAGKVKVIEDIKHNAQLRAENFRPCFKKVFGAIAGFKADKIYQNINNAKNLHRN